MNQQSSMDEPEPTDTAWLQPAACHAIDYHWFYGAIGTVRRSTAEGDGTAMVHGMQPGLGRSCRVPYRRKGRGPNRFSLDAPWPADRGVGSSSIEQPMPVPAPAAAEDTAASSCFALLCRILALFCVERVAPVLSESWPRFKRLTYGSTNSTTTLIFTHTHGSGCLINLVRSDHDGVVRVYMLCTARLG
jgi:hypothetical protein